MSGAISGWLGSAVLHCALLVLIMLFVQRPFGPAAGGGGGGAGDRNGDWIDASFGFEAESADEESGGDSEIVPVSFELPAASHEPVDPVDSFSQALSSPIEQPEIRLAHSAELSGAAARQAARGNPNGDFGPESTAGSGSGGGSTSGTGTSPDLGAGNGRGGTSLFGIADSGARYIYVIDRSISMQDSSALDAAKAELAASLSRINPTEEFQIIFFNHRSQALVPRKAAEVFFRGTEPHRRLAFAQMQLIPPEGATLPLPALLEALNLRPDVVFFLTDGEEPGLSPGEVHRLRERNAGRARIHCIRFVNNDAEPSASGNWMQELAAQNAGQYVVRDLRPPANSN